MNPKLVKLCIAAMSDGCETTLRELASCMDLSSAMVLEQIECIRQRIGELDLELIPGLTAGDFESHRILRGTTRKIINAETINATIANGEGSSLEFKETFIFDTKRAIAVPSTPTDKLKSEEVIHSSLKTIAAFLTCGGGRLLVGVHDSGNCSGIERDFPFVKGSCLDGWMLELRGLIEARFKDGKAINDYVVITPVPVQGAIVAVVDVQRRRQLAFFRTKAGASYTLYRRQGNRSVEVPYEDIEDFLSIRLTSGWC